jgi:hypothetical protein
MAAKSLFGILAHISQRRYASLSLMLCIINLQVLLLTYVFTIVPSLLHFKLSQKQNAQNFITHTVSQKFQLGGAQFWDPVIASSVPACCT